MNFIRWSNLHPHSKLVLKPTLGIRGWDEIPQEAKELIYQHFKNKGWFKAGGDTHRAVLRFNEDHKAANYCHHLQGHGGPHYYDSSGRGFSHQKDCCYGPAEMDINRIFIRETRDVVYELISYYAQVLKGITYNNQYKNFSNCFNDISDQFGLDIMLSDNGIVLRQDPKISKEIYEPVLNFLADKKWEPVNRDLGDAFSDYLKNTPTSYSSCITHAISGLQAFLQILVEGKTGKGDIADLFKEAQKQKLIPDNRFSSTALKEIISVLMIERQSKGDPHPKKEYGNEKEARLVLNLIMVFIQHVIQK